MAIFLHGDAFVDRGAWKPVVHRVATSWTRRKRRALSQCTVCADSLAAGLCCTCRAPALAQHGKAEAQGSCPQPPALASVPANSCSGHGREVREGLTPMRYVISAIFKTSCCARWRQTHCGCGRPVRGLLFPSHCPRPLGQA